jgi:hypothetical protein
VILFLCMPIDLDSRDANDVKKNRDSLFPTGMKTYSMGISLMHSHSPACHVCQVMVTYRKMEACFQICEHTSNVMTVL